MTGNKALLKVDQKVAMVMEQTLRMFHHCGMPLTDCDMLQCDGKSMEKIIVSTPEIRNT